MNKDTSNMRYVAFFDMLGFKEAVKRDIEANKPIPNTTKLHGTVVSGVL